MTIETDPNPQPGSEWIVGGGQMGQLIRAMDWSTTHLGPIALWPQSLRTTINLCLASDLPICIIWGPERVQLYNDAYRVICGEKHPRSMGQNFPDCWREAWPVIGAAHDSAVAGDTAFLEDQHIFLERRGYTEECFFTFSFSPIRDETGKLAGLFHPVIETTAKMLGERRTRTLRDLTSGISNVRSVEDAFKLSAQTVSDYTFDLPFMLIYRLEEKQRQARLVGSTGLAPGMTGAPETLPLDEPDTSAWPLAAVFRSGNSLLLDDVETRFGGFSVGPFPEPIASAMLLPIMMPGAERPMAVVVAGVSPRLKSDEMYLGFHALLSGAIANAVANADAYEAERSRAEALARIDRAKTEFFSNVSHEFRTPLTLMLGPLNDALSIPDMPVHGLELVDLAYRNSQRLLRLVNSLLNFSRIEAGRAQAAYVPVDLAAFTAVLASNFRSACERAGLTLLVDCPPLPVPVFVDWAMWETIVLNLLSNAFKFTFEGEIFVSVRAEGDRSVLTVRDSGVGIPETELPRMFERFHRVENQKGRSFEGSGIGLSLVQELVKLHKGTIEIASEVGRGTEFSISIPLGSEHLPRCQVSSAPARDATAETATAYVEEALRWLPNDPVKTFDGGRYDVPLELAELANVERARVIVADDNADMRTYVRRLLGAYHDVEVVADGLAALGSVRERRPDLLITDVMMPRLDGMGLLRAIRSDPDLGDLPVIMLSARAGEDASIKGLSAGADDYLSKPFSARELVARVNSLLAMARMQRENGEALRQLNIALEQRVADQTAERDEIWRNSHDLMTVSSLDAVMLAMNPAWTELLGWSETELVGTHYIDLVHPDDLARTLAEAEALKVDGHRTVRFENRYRRKDGGWVWLSWAVSSKSGRFYGIARDITAEKAREAELETAHEALRQSQKMEAIGQLTGGVAHDFNNLLTPVMMGLEMLRRSHGDARSQKLIGGALQSAERAKTLVQRLLAFARRQTLEPRAVDPATLLGDMSELIDRSLGPRVKVVLDVPPGLPAALVDPNQLELAILNLAVNARDAMPDGGILTIAVDSASLRDGEHRDLAAGCYVRFTVSDTGCGMDAATLARSVEPFFSTKDVGQGTGLGLPMVQGLAAQSGGVLRVASQLGRGTQASLWIPATARAVEAAVSRLPAALPTVRPAVVLLVDDEELVRQSTAEGLRSLEYEVVEAASAAKALDWLASGLKPDLVVTDHMMPGMSGVQLANELRRTAPRLPVLVITGYANLRADQTDGLEVLAKPYGQTALAARVASMLDDLD